MKIWKCRNVDHTALISQVQVVVQMSSERKCVFKTVTKFLHCSLGGWPSGCRSNRFRFVLAGSGFTNLLVFLLRLLVSLAVRACEHPGTISLMRMSNKLN